MKKDKWFLNGGRESGRSIRLLCETYGNKIAKLEKENAELRAKESFVGDQNRKLCEQQQKIEVLEAENAELKMQLYAFDEEREKKLNENIDLKKQNKTKEPALNYIAQLEAENRKLNAYNAKLLQSDIDKQNKISLLSAKIQKLEKILVNHPELKEE